MTDEREQQEVELVESFKEILKGLQAEIREEKAIREQSESTMLNLIEDTCGKLASQAQF